jgi:hypothetical protein
MTSITPQYKVFWSLLSNSKHSGVPKDSKSPTLGVGVSSSHFTQSGVATKGVFILGMPNLTSVTYFKALGKKNSFPLFLAIPSKDHEEKNKIK